MNNKELKLVSKQNICGNFTANREFAKDFKRITGKLGTYNKAKKIRDIVDKEIDNGIITTKEEVLQRGTELIHEIYVFGEEVQPKEKEFKTTNTTNSYCPQCGTEIEVGNYCPECGEKINNNKEVEPLKTKYNIELPYTSSGVMLGYGRGTFGGAGFIGSRAGEGRTNWRYHKCYIRENGLSIEETGDFIRFDKIESINTGEEEGILIKHINVCLELKDETNFSFRIHPRDLSLLRIIEDNMIPEDEIIPENNTTVENNNSALDELLKAKELLEAGLLTEEEFKELKIKLLNNI